MAWPFKPNYGRGSIAKFCDFWNLENFTTIKTQPCNELHTLEAKNAKKRIYIQLSQLDMGQMKLPELINLGDSGRHVIGTVYRGCIFCKLYIQTNNGQLDIILGQETTFLKYAMALSQCILNPSLPFCKKSPKNITY